MIIQRNSASLAADISMGIFISQIMALLTPLLKLVFEQVRID
jgi:hypothetical protein